MKNQQSLNKQTAHRILAIFYSHSGVTEKVVQTIWREADGDLYRIHTTDEYPKDIHRAAKEAEKDRASGKLPELRDSLSGISGYDLIVVGGPVWSETVSTPLMSFLAQTNFKGRAVAPLWTNTGNSGTYEKDFTSQIHSAVLLPGLELPDTITSDERLLSGTLNEWISGLEV